MSVIPRHVVIDLLPLYLAGELSPETEREVEQYLRTDAELTGRVEAARHEVADESTKADLRTEIEMAALRRTRSMLTLQRWLFGLALAFTAVGLSVTARFRGGRVDRFRLMITEFPVQFGTCLIIAAVLWVLHFYWRRRLST